MNIYHALIDLRLVDLYHELVRDPDPAVRTVNVLIAADSFKGQMPTLLRLQAEGKVGSTFVDSQTYGMNPKGQNPGLIDRFEELKLKLTRLSDPFDYVASVDDRFNEPTHNQQNYFELKRELDGVLDSQGRNLADKLVPGVHDRNAADEFLMYAESGAKLIGMGSSPAPSPEQWDLINEIKTDYGVKVHRFGNLGFDDLVKWRIDSADSTRYARATMHGMQMCYWDADLKKPVDLKMRSGKKIQDKHVAFLSDTFGITLAEMIADPHLTWVANMYAMQKSQQYLTTVLGI